MTEKMSNTLINNYITALDYAGKTLMVLSGATSGVSLCLFTTIIGTSFGITSASISLVFLISNGIVRMYLKTMRRQKKTERLF